MLGQRIVHDNLFKAYLLKKMNKFQLWKNPNSQRLLEHLNRKLRELILSLIKQILNLLGMILMPQMIYYLESMRGTTRGCQSRDCSLKLLYSQILTLIVLQIITYLNLAWQITTQHFLHHLNPFRSPRLHLLKDLLNQFFQELRTYSSTFQFQNPRKKNQLWILKTQKFNQ